MPIILALRQDFDLDAELTYLVKLIKIPTQKVGEMASMEIRVQSLVLPLKKLGVRLERWFIG